MKNSIFFVMLLIAQLLSIVSVKAEDSFDVILEGKQIFDIAFDGDYIWCIESQGPMFRYNRKDNTIQHFTESDGLFPGTYFCVTKDKNALLWFGASKGINTYYDHAWNSYSEKDNIYWGNIEDVAVDHDNIKWFLGHGIVIFNGTEWTRLPNVSYYNIFVDHNNTKWFAGNGSRAKYDVNGLEILDDIYDEYYYHWVAVDNNDVQFWSDGETLRIVNGETITDYDIPATAFVLDKDNVMWIGGSYRGLWKHEKGEISQVVDYLSLELYEQVWDMEVDEDGNIWMAIQTTTGYNTGVLVRYTPDRDPVSVQSTKPKILSIIHTYPNPFNAETTLAFELPSDSVTKLAVYDCMGRKVRELLNGDMRAGKHSVLWDGRDDSGVSVGSGVYFSRLSAGEMSANGRMLFVK